jgi:hypothetical protein
MGRALPGADILPHRDTVDNLNCGVDVARWPLGSWSIWPIMAPPTPGEPTGAAEAKAHRGVPRAGGAEAAAGWIVCTAVRTRAMRRSGSSRTAWPRARHKAHTAERRWDVRAKASRIWPRRVDFASRTARAGSCKRT